MIWHRILRTPIDAFRGIVENGLELYERKRRSLDILFFPEILEHIAQVTTLYQRIREVCF